MSYKELISKDSNNFHDTRNIRVYYKDKSLNLIKKICFSQNLNYNVCTLSLHGNLNVGTIMRTCQLMGVNRYFVFGRRIFDTRSTVGSDKYIKLIRISGIKGYDETLPSKYISKLSLEDRLLCPNKFYQSMIDYNLVPIFLEQTQDAIFEDEINWKLVHAQIPDGKEICFIFGNEGDGIAKDILDAGKRIEGSATICIRQLGAMQSLNVSAAAAIILSNYKNWAIKNRLAYLSLG
jgi:tRNA(Leu) C34 or U34 (ribose-2'-O)-methylase TrmL